MAFSFSISDIKSDLVGLIKNLELIKLNYQSRAAIYKFLSTDPNNSDVNETMKKLGLSSTDNPPGSVVFKFVESLPQLIPEIKDHPDYETKMKSDNNFIFNILIAKTINKLIEEYRQEFHKFTETEQNEIIQKQIDSEKNNEGKFKDQLIQLQNQKLENEKREQLLLTLAFLQAMKQRYSELQQREVELTIELKKNISTLIGTIFTTVDGKTIPKEAQNIIADRVIDFQKNKFLEIRSEIINNLDQHNGKQYAPGKVLPDAVTDADSKVFNSLKWQAANESGVADIVRNVYSEQGLQHDESILSMQVKAFIQAEEPEARKVFKEVAAARDAEEIIKEEYLERANIINSVQESPDFSVDFDFLDLSSEPASPDYS
jgi:hypothetical protein